MSKLKAILKMFVLMLLAFLGGLSAMLLLGYSIVWVGTTYGILAGGAIFLVLICLMLAIFSEL